MLQGQAMSTSCPAQYHAHGPYLHIVPVRWTSRSVRRQGQTTTTRTQVRRHTQQRTQHDPSFQQYQSPILTRRVCTMCHQVSDRVEATDTPVIVKTKALIAASGRSDVVSLAQGIVHWPPPRAALQVRLGSLHESPLLHT